MKLWTPNQKLDNGRFIIDKIIGSGGFGITYSAKEKSRDKLVVIKTLNQIQQTKEDFERHQVKFLNEALRLAKCSHPHIVQVYEVIQEDGLWGMVMEYIDGQDLGVYIEKQGTLSESEALIYIAQIAQALEYVHQQGFLHRDVKPSNIILRRETKTAVLIDFGLAREYTQGQTGNMTNAKTLGYAPIEQYERRGVFGAYTDVYSLAATLYHLLTNKIPIPANFRAQGVPLPPPKEYNSQISDRINRAILNGMALEPRQRPQSIQEFKDLLKSAKTITSQPTYQPKLEKPNLIECSNSTINYNQLESLLASGQWKAANEETVKVMLTITKREIAGWLRVEDIEKFPCPELRIIDQFWTHYSNNHFGFTVQQQLHQNLGGTRKFNKDVWGAFVQQVGWKQENRWLRYEDFSFHLQAPKAHLPFPWVMGLENWAFAGVWITSLAWKIVKCNI